MYEIKSRKLNSQKVVMVEDCYYHFYFVKELGFHGHIYKFYK